MCMARIGYKVTSSRLHQLKESFSTGQYPFGEKKLLGDVTSGLAMVRIIGIDLLDATGASAKSLKVSRPLADWSQSRRPVSSINTGRPERVNTRCDQLKPSSAHY